MTSVRHRCDIGSTEIRQGSDVVKQARGPDVIVQELTSDRESSQSPDIARILVLGGEGWEERTVDLKAIAAALSGANQVERKQSLSTIIRTQVRSIAAARKRGASWTTICDVFVGQGIPVDPDALRKLYWRITNDRGIGKRMKRTQCKTVPTRTNPKERNHDGNM